MKYEIELINVGRRKVCKKFSPEDCVGLPETEIRAWKEVQKYLASSYPELVHIKDELYNVVVGGFRKVGEVKITERK